jgi:hypothetical protein
MRYETENLELPPLARQVAELPLEPEPALERELPLEPTEADERPARRDVRAQIARLDAELAAFPAEGRSPGETTDGLPRANAHVADLGELEAARDALIDLLRGAREACARRSERERLARLRLEEMVRDPARHRWESISNAELGEPGCTGYYVTPRLGPLGVLMSWWRVRISSGCPLAGPCEAASEMRTILTQER